MKHIQHPCYYEPNVGAYLPIKHTETEPVDVVLTTNGYYTARKRK